MDIVWQFKDSLLLLSKTEISYYNVSIKKIKNLSVGTNVIVAQEPKIDLEI